MKLHHFIVSLCLIAANVHAACDNPVAIPTSDPTRTYYVYDGGVAGGLTGASPEIVEGALAAHCKFPNEESRTHFAHFLCVQETHFFPVPPRKRGLSTLQRMLVSNTITKDDFFKIFRLICELEMNQSLSFESDEEKLKFFSSHADALALGAETPARNVWNAYYQLVLSVPRASEPTKKNKDVRRCLFGQGGFPTPATVTSPDEA